MARRRLQFRVMLAGLVLAGVLPCSASALARVVVLPFMPEDASPLREGGIVTAKLAERLDARGEVVGLDWDDLRQLLGGSLRPAELSSPGAARAVGRLLGAEGVVMGSFAGRSGRWLARARMVHVPSGRISAARTWELERDILVQPPPFEVSAPVIDDDEAAGLRDALWSSPCEGAGERVDALERKILDMKARYWALQLARGVHMAGIKFNPGSTISDHELKREFYDRIRQWQAQDFIPELTPLEIKEFAEIDQQAVRLARRCGIL